MYQLVQRLRVNKRHISKHAASLHSTLHSVLQELVRLKQPDQVLSQSPRLRVVAYALIAANRIRRAMFRRIASPEPVPMYIGNEIVRLAAPSSIVPSAAVDFAGVGTSDTETVHHLLTALSATDALMLPPLTDKDPMSHLSTGARIRLTSVPLQVNNLVRRLEQCVQQWPLEISTLKRTLTAVSEESAHKTRELKEQQVSSDSKIVELGDSLRMKVSMVDLLEQRNQTLTLERDNMVHRDKYNAAMAEVDLLVERTRILSQENDNHAIQNAQLRNTVAELRTSLRDLEDHKLRDTVLIEQRSKELDMRREENDRLKHYLNARSRESMEQKREHDKEIEALSLEKEKVSSSASSMTAQLVAVQHEANNAKFSLAQAQHKLTEKDTEILRLKHLVKRKEEQIASNTGLIDGLRDSHSRVTAELGSVQQELFNTQQAHQRTLIESERVAQDRVTKAKLQSAAELDLQRVLLSNTTSMRDTSPLRVLRESPTSYLNSSTFNLPPATTSVTQHHTAYNINTSSSSSFLPPSHKDKDKILPPAGITPRVGLDDYSNILHDVKQTPEGLADRATPPSAGPASHRGLPNRTSGGTGAGMSAENNEILSSVIRMDYQLGKSLAGSQASTTTPSSLSSAPSP
eukprot:TRINITY_DN62070_c0_g1_i1.p1 TRINITY_DN62070_c0_g1~~TRINITY_DN62070_c0_g1_i1.p1  ORF type:complete len:632 (+),score=34.85 TRINITY_DN62070_c0_g1_i1:2-1897(+)